MIFKIEKKLKDGLGRVGIITTPHGDILTPAFVAVGTKATVKSLNPEQVRDAGTQVVLGNTYHLYLQPGDEIVRDAGGIGNFMNWRRNDGGIAPTMTDSGGFQVFSLGAAYGKDISKITKITDPSLLIPERFDDSDAPRLAKIGQDGVSFKSHLDGSIHYITPEKSIQIQHNLGADIIFAFDECTSPTEDSKYQGEALERTHRWAERSLREHQKLLTQKQKHSQDLLLRNVDRSSASVSDPALFGIVQGGREESLRKQSAKIISEINVEGKYFDGFGIGGSFAKEDMSTAVKWVNEILPEDKPRHLLGIGEPEDLFMGIENGVDLFDCVLPTRLGRNGTIYTKKGKIIITNAKFRNDLGPIEDDCGCYVCSAPEDFFSGSLSVSADTALPLGSSACETPRKETSGTPRYSRAYIAHLFHGKEMLAGTLASIHNLYFIVNLVKKIRQSILDDKFFEFKEEFLKGYLR
ncbi:MAG: tRNA guanosine(34) transglycosylase Tgt [Candidatus Paceibacterota bacterium]